MRVPALHAAWRSSAPRSGAASRISARSSGSASTCRRAVHERPLYPDALPCLTTLRESGLRVGAVGNMAIVHEELVLRRYVDFVASSERWGVEKPDSACSSTRMIDGGRAPAAAEIAYVGDRVDNDIEPALAAGMVAVHVRRGPWGASARPAARGDQHRLARTSSPERSRERLPRRHRLRRARVRGRRAARARRRAHRSSARHGGPQRRRRARARAHRRGARRGRAWRTSARSSRRTIRRSQGADSLELLREAWRRVREAGWELANADVVLIGEEPRLAPHRDAMRARLAERLGVEPERSRCARRRRTARLHRPRRRSRGAGRRSAAPMKLRILTHAEQRPARHDAEPLAGVHEPRPDRQRFWPRLYEVYADFQLWVLDGKETVGYACTLPVHLGRHGRAARRRLGDDERRRRATPTTLCAVVVSILPSYRGTGHRERAARGA